MGYNGIVKTIVETMDERRGKISNILRSGNDVTIVNGRSMVSSMGGAWCFLSDRISPVVNGGQWGQQWDGQVSSMGICPLTMVNGLGSICFVGLCTIWEIMS